MGELLKSYEEYFIYIYELITTQSLKLDIYKWHNINIGYTLVWYYHIRNELDPICSKKLALRRKQITQS